MGNITQRDEIIIDGYIVKENLKEKVTLKIDTGFTGYDVGRFRAPLQIVISLLIWTYSMEELLNIFDHFTKK